MYLEGESSNIFFELSPFSYIKEGVGNKVKNWLEVIVILHTLFNLASRRELKYKSECHSRELQFT